MSYRIKINLSPDDIDAVAVIRAALDEAAGGDCGMSVSAVIRTAIHYTASCSAQSLNKNDEEQACLRSETTAPSGST